MRPLPQAAGNGNGAIGEGSGQIGKNVATRVRVQGMVMTFAKASPFERNTVDLDAAKWVLERETEVSSLAL